MKVLLKDSHAMFRAGMRYILRELNGEMAIFEAQNCTQARRIIEQTEEINLILIGLNTLGQNDIDCVKAIVSCCDNTPVLTLSNWSDLEKDVELAEVGVTRNLKKSASVEEMLCIIGDLLNGKERVSPNQNQHRITSTIDIREQLSERQQRILKLVADGWSNRKIALKMDEKETDIRAEVTKVYKLLNLKARSDAKFYKWRAQPSKDVVSES